MNRFYDLPKEIEYYIYEFIPYKRKKEMHITTLEFVIINFIRQKYIYLVPKDRPTNPTNFRDVSEFILHFFYQYAKNSTKYIQLYKKFPHFPQKCMCASCLVLEI